MKVKLIIELCLVSCLGTLTAQTTSKFIIVDQFGYLPDSKKVAVMRDPQVGFDADESFTPGQNYVVVNAVTGEQVLSGKPVLWNMGVTDASSGDKAWHFDFSSVTEPGRYFILDKDQNLRSFEFEVSPIVYNELLKHAVRSFYYQRLGFPKEAQYAGTAWADGASHIGPLQDKNCRLFSDKNNAATELDLSGGWYDAGDLNKYTSWTANYVVEMMKAYLEKPNAWGDDYNIPESGNGIPDLLDEAKWGIDFLLRMQRPDGSVLCVVSESHASPPSSARTEPVWPGYNISKPEHFCGICHRFQSLQGHWNEFIC
jgi:endoglucanase